MSELEFISRLKRRARPSPFVKVGIGDDTALCDFAPSGETLVTVDMIMDGVHFILARDPLGDIGRKALGVNLSDIAAMGGEAVAAFVALAVPRTMREDDLTAIYAGIERLAAEFSVTIAGGDTNSWSGPLAISVTVLGRPHKKGVILRSGAKAKDAIFVTGELGGSLASGKHLRFTPRLAEAKALVDRYAVTAMMDLSDGLAGDLRKLCAASGVGAALYPAKIPVTASLIPSFGSEAAQVKALTDGEDFELLFTMSDREASRLAKDVSFKIPITRIGYCLETTDLYWDVDGSLEPIKLHGFEHRFGEG